jgi:O-antigen ligase
MVSRKGYFLENVLIFTCFAIYFFPGIKLTSSFQIKIDDILVLGIFFLIFLYRPQLYKNIIFFAYFLSIIAIIVSTFFGYIFLSVPVSLRDINEIIRLSKPLLLIILVLQADTDYIVRKIEKLLIPLCLLIIVIAFIEYFNIMGIGKKIASLYAPEHHVMALSKSSRRIMITGSDPNIGAAIVLFFWLYCFFYFFQNKKKIYLFFLLILTVIVLMTSSRTAFLALLSVISFFLLFSKSSNLVFKTIMIVLIIGLIIFLYDKFQYIALGFRLLLAGQNTSLLARFDRWDEAFQFFQKSPIFGWGPGKGMMTTIVDGEYFLLLRRYGIIGTVIILYSIFYPLFSFKQKYNFIIPKNVNLLDTVLKYYLIVIICVMITNVFYSSYQLLLPFVFLCTVVYKEKRSYYILKESLP